MRYTENQAKAIQCIDRDVAVVAGAGTGKTRVLVDRIINIITSGKASIDEIVAITYTNKAAVEIKERVRKVIQEEIVKGNDRLKSARGRLMMARIGTIHSFCNRIIRENPVEAGIDPECTILDEMESNKLLNDSAVSGLNNLLSDNGIFLLAKELSYDGLLSSLISVYTKLRNQGLSIEEFASYADNDKKRLVVRLIKEIDRIYSDEKRSLNAIDYEDILRLTYKVFMEYPNILKYYQRNIKYLLVDEYQDLNFIQDRIIRLLWDNVNLFVVGDKKQSIYRFRGARVELFDKLYSDICKVGEGISLDDNFRSVPGIIEFVNNGFRDVMEDYGELKPYRKDNGSHVELLFSDGEKMEDKKFNEAALIAKRIKKIIHDKTPVFDKELEAYRQAKFGDIAVLFRKRTHLGYYISEFKRNGIPYHVIMNGGLMESRFVRDILNALIAIEKDEDIYVYGTLTNLLGISEELLAKIKLANGKLSFEEMDDENVKKAYETISKWRMAKDVLCISELVDRIAYDTGLYDRSASKDEQSIADLLKFKALCNRYDDKGYTLGMFLDDLDYYAENEGEAVITKEDSDVVKFVTIHSSKGLEFPIVIFADASSVFGKSESSHIIFEPGVGMGISTEKDDYDKLKSVIDFNEKEEYKRLLYVVLTRAKDMLIISGSQKYPQNSFMTWISDDFVNDSQQLSVIDDVEDIKIPVPSDIKESKGSEFHSVKIKIDRYFRATALGDYLRCPRKYALMYLDLDDVLFSGIGAQQDSVISGSERGSLVHSIIEKAESGDDLQDLLRKYTSDLAEADADFIRRCVNNYSQSDFSRYKGMSEYDLMLDLGDGIHVNGRADKIIVDGDLVKLVDFKTNSYMDDDLLKSYELQLRIYAIAYRDILLHKGKADNTKMEAYLFNVNAGKIIDVDVCDKTLEQTKNLIIKMIHGILDAKKIDDFKKNHNCRLCSYKGNLCR